MSYCDWGFKAPGSQRPLATVVIGGLTTSTGLTLLVLPDVYAWLERPRRMWSPRLPQPARLAMGWCSSCRSKRRFASASRSAASGVHEQRGSNLHSMDASGKVQAAQRAVARRFSH